MLSAPSETQIEICIRKIRHDAQEQAHDCDRHGSAHLPRPVAIYTQSYAQSQNQGQNNDKYSLKSPSGIAFSDFRGYEDWADVSSARTDEILKVIVANPTMIKAFRPAFRATASFSPTVP